MMCTSSPVVHFFPWLFDWVVLTVVMLALIQTFWCLNKGCGVRYFFSVFELALYISNDCIICICVDARKEQG